MKGAAVWTNVVVPVIAPDGCTRTEIDSGLSQAEKLLALTAAHPYMSA